MTTKKILDKVRLHGLTNKASDAKFDSKNLSVPEYFEDRFLELEKLFGDKATSGGIDAGNADLVAAAFGLAAEAAVAGVLVQASDLELAEALIKSSRAFRRKQLEALLDIAKPELDCSVINTEEFVGPIKRRPLKTSIAAASL